MRLSQIRVFLAVADAGSVRTAARRLGVSPPAVSKTIRALEDELHARLLERSATGVVMSAAGRAFADRVRIVDSELRRACEDVAEFSGDRSGSVAFGGGPMSMSLIVPEALSRFLLQRPRARVRVVEGRHPTLIPLVREGTLDFAVTPRPSAEIKGLAFRPLLHDPLVVLARKAHPMSKASSLAELAPAKWVSATPARAADSALHKAFSHAGLPVPENVLDCESLSAVIQLLARTDMLTVTTRLALSVPVACEVLQEIPISEPLPSFTYGLIIREDTPLSRIATDMARTVATVARYLAARTRKDISGMR